jgi:hypothetical protein
VTSRTLVVNQKFLLNKTSPETVFVVATAKYKGAPLANSPLRIPVVVKSKFLLP